MRELKLFDLICPNISDYHIIRYLSSISKYRNGSEEMVTHEVVRGRFCFNTTGTKRIQFVLETMFELALS